MTIFSEFAADHHLTKDELSELGLALKIVRGGCGTVNGKEFPKRELLERLRDEAWRQQSFGAIYMAEVLDCAANTCLEKFVADFEREQYRRRSGK